MNGDGWVKSADRALALSADRIKLIRAVTPANAASELALLEEAFLRRSPRLPRWTYDVHPVSSELCFGLEKLAGFLEEVSPLGQVYAARARELCLEASIIDAVGTPRLGARAEERFVCRTEEARADRRKADELAAAWTRGGDNEGGEDSRTARRALRERSRTCDAGDPSSLISRMSCEAGRHKLPMRIVLQPGLASLAATGDGVILVAPHKWVAPRDVERTVLHEIAAHALPRARAASAPLGICAVGTAYGIDDQEGRALLIERSAGFLDGPRRRELGLRHLAACAALEGANLIDVARLLQERGATTEEAVRIGARVLRGGCRASGGLAREIVYLPAFSRVERALSGQFAAVTERMMAGGRIAADVAIVVERALRQRQPRQSLPQDDVRD
jgi:hypothetical protein